MTDRPISEELRDISKEFSDDADLVVENKIQHELKHEAMNRIHFLESSLGVISTKTKKCTCGALDGLEELIEALMRKDKP